MRMFPAIFPAALNPFTRVAAFCLLLCYITGAAAATFTVTNTADSGAGSLRQAVTDAKTQSVSSIVVFAPELSGQTITLASEIATGDPMQILTTIDASALPGGLTISGNNATRIFRNAGTLTLIGLKLVGGKGISSFDYGSGGAIHNLGTLTLLRCTLSGNSTIGSFSAYGGAIYNDRTTQLRGTLTLSECTLSGNSTTKGSGGAIYNNDGIVTIKYCTVSGNSTSDYSGLGGAIFNGGDKHSLTLTLAHCTLSENSASALAGYGGAICNESVMKLTHCTLSGNTANRGGAIFTAGDITLINSIVAANSAAVSADIHLDDGFIYRSGVNLIGKNNSLGFNFRAGSPNPEGNYVGTNSAPLDPRLAPLGKYGASTQTMALLPDSVARNHATVLSPAIFIDQRGFPIVGVPDIGAYEAGTTNNFSVWAIENAGIVLTFNGDGDGDGLADGLEYATRSNPIAGSLNPLTGPTRNGAAGMILSFPYRDGAKDLRYILGRSADFDVWTEIYRYDTSTGATTETGVASQRNAATQIITITDPATGPANFWQLRIERVP